MPVVLVGPAATWSRVLDLVAAGLERRVVDPVGRRVDLQAAAELLVAALPPTPSVLVGHSLLGLLVAHLGTIGLPAVAGVVLVDPTPPGCLSAVAQLDEELAVAGSFDVGAWTDQVQGLVAPSALGELPTALVVPTRPEAWPSFVPAWYRAAIEAGTPGWRATGRPGLGRPRSRGR